MNTPDSRRETTTQFLRFAAIGTAGFVVDSAALYVAMHGPGAGLYLGRVLSWFCAATFTWAMNRRFTFADSRPPLRQWLAFLAANAVGGAVNYAVYAILVSTSQVAAATPMIGVAAGSIAGLAFNFITSKWLVFRRGAATS